MNQTAQVDSIHSLQDFHTALARFGVQARAALDSAAWEIRHTLDGLQQQLKAWQQRAYECQEEVNRARAALSHSRALHDGKSVGSGEQEIALAKARHQLREAEAKVEAVRRWQRLLPEAVAEYEGPARHLSGLLEADLRHALAVLEGRIAALQAYVALAPPSRPEAPAAPADAPAPGADAPGSPGKE
jgi:hypothetical protein